jgi:outer membrane protein assembly factor BamD (BamD/ComL family)
LRRGQVQTAKALYAKARERADAESAPELAIVAAEIELAQQRYRKAIAAYLAVTKRYPRTSQGDSALFAATQVAFDHADASYDGRALLNRYLAAYPKGRFREDARRLQRALDK